MSAKTRLLHTIKVNRQFRKFEEKLQHPALDYSWDLLTAEEKERKFRVWKMQNNKR